MEENNVVELPAARSISKEEIPLWMSLLIALGATSATVAGPVYLPSVGVDIALFGCAVMAYLGLHTAIPPFLKGKPQLCSMLAVGSGGLTVKLFMELPTLEPQAQTWVWILIAVLCFASGKPLNSDNR